MSDQTMSTAPAIGARRVILVASAGLLAFERLALMGLMYLLTGADPGERRHPLFALPDLLDR